MHKTRKEAREKLLELVFEYTFTKVDQSLLLEEVDSFDENSKTFVLDSYNGICKNFNVLDEILKENVKDFSLSQVFKLDYAILLVAIYELKFTQTPKNIVINEAIDLAKKYSTDKSGGFVNGVLSSVVGEKNGK